MHKEVLWKQKLVTLDDKYPLMKIQERIKHRQCPDMNLKSTIEITWNNGNEMGSFAQNKEKSFFKKNHFSMM